jgi:Xaa-Pro aminopeptidase
MTMTTAPALVFSPAEYARRLAALREAMRAREADLVLVDEAEHLCYLTGFDRSATRYQVCAVPLAGDPVMVLRSLDEPSFRERSWLTECVTVADWEDPVAVLAGTLAGRGWASGRIGLELDSNYLTPRRWQAITAALPEARFVDFGEVLRELRLRKSPEEIAYLRKAAWIADQAILIAIEAAGEGQPERAAAIAAGRAFLDLGADHARAGVITSGRRSGSLHGVLGNRRLERGDILHLELVPQVHGYSSRIMRPAVMGPPSPAQAHAARLLIEIQDRQLAAMKPGAVGRDVDLIAREGILGAGLRERYENATGYTLGYYAPWSPRTSDFTRLLVPTAGWAMEPGMVFHMYVSASGVAFSETMLVTEDGAERLTRAERRLFER